MTNSLFKSVKKVLIVEDHPVTRMGLRGVLKKMMGEVPIYEAADGITGWEAYCQQSPDLVILDLDIPKGNGIVLAKRILRLCPSQHILLLTSRIDDDSLYQAGVLGIKAIVLKKEVKEIFAKACTMLLSGKSFYSASLHKNTYFVSPERGRFERKRLNKLSDTEREVLLAIAKGETSVQIAARMYKSTHTIRRHRYSICKKLELPQENYSLLRFAKSWAILLEAL